MVGHLTVPMIAVLITPKTDVRRNPLTEAPLAAVVVVSVESMQGVCAEVEDQTNHAPVSLLCCEMTLIGSVQDRQTIFWPR